MSVHPLKNKIYFNTHTRTKIFRKLEPERKNTTTNNK